MLKTANGKTGEGAIGSLKRGDTVDFVLKTNVGEDMMWAEDAETGEKVQRLTQNKETGLWEGAAASVNFNCAFWSMTGCSTS